MRRVLKWIILSVAAIVVVAGLHECSNSMGGTVIKYELHNMIVECSPEYNNVIDDVMREVYTTFVRENIESAEMSLNEWDTIYGEEYYQEEKQKMEKAKELLSSDPEKAAELYLMLGSCHIIEGLKKTILKEKYGITWYTPAEVHPDIIYD